MGSLDRPDRPDEPGRAEQADARGPDRPTPKPRELPDSDERGRAYEAMLAHFSGTTATEASPGQQPDGTQRRSYQAEVPRHLDTWADHERRWPPRPRAVMDRPADPVASDDAVARVQEAEPRFSADAQAIEQENKDNYGGWLAGFEHRKDFSWKFTPVIVERERGDFADELVEVSHERASKIVEYFRQKWGPYGQPLDS